MRYRVLGSIEAEGSEGPVALGGARQRRLLGGLLAADGRIVTAERLAAAVWGDELEPPDTGPKVVQSYVSRLRSALGDGCVLTHDGGYSLPLDGHEVDGTRFEDLVTRARAERPGPALATLATALAMWRGPAFGEFAGERWARPHATRLEELRLVAHELRIQALLDTGRHAEAVPELEALTAEHPLRDRLHAHHLLALYRSGRQAEALRAFVAHRAYLADETGLEPSRELVDLERRIALDDPSLGFVTAGQTRRGYVLADVIGEGAYGTVYRAIQPSVGREVAVKVVRPELADDPQFVRRFDAEARLVARLEHPSIVPLYDYWREPGGAYLVFRYLRGGTVADVAHPWPLSDATQLVTDVGAALATAHFHGVVHRDVKPANLLRDGDGRTYLADFGIALDVPGPDAPSAMRSAGSPLYASPEQVRDGTATDRSDQYALAVVLWELLAGRPPFAADTVTGVLREKLARPLAPLAATRPDLPDALGRVLQRASALRPEDRYGSIVDFVDAWGEALDRSPVGATTTGDVALTDVSTIGVVADARATRSRLVLELDLGNPYKGLRPFDEADTADFFGRSDATERLRTLVAGQRLSIVVGASGSGKSSIVRAGLVPRLRADGHLVAVVVPGARPLDELSDALVQLASGPLGDVREALTDPPRLAALVESLAPATGGDLVMVLDQFEELWTLCADTVRDRLLVALATVVDAPGSRLRLVVTVRADFYDRPLAHPSLGALVRDGTFPLPPLAPHELEQAITAPATRLGVALEPALVAALLTEVSGRTNSLPLLQFALTELFDRRHGATMTLAGYETLGGVAGTLARRAEDVVATTDPEASRRLFRRLVTPSDDRADTRRRARRSELDRVPDAVVDTFATARLLTFDVDPSTREPTVEVAHEALLHHWPRLRGWLDSDRDGLRLQRQLGERADVWAAQGRDPADLYQGGRLDDALAWAGTHDDDLAPVERDFLDAAHRRERRARAVRRGAVGALIGLLAIAVAAAGFATVRGREARHQRDAATSARRQADLGRLRAESVAVTSRDLSLALLLAHEAYQRDPGLASESAMLGALGATPAVLGYLRGGSPAYRLAASPDGRRLYVGRRDGLLDVWDLATRTLVVSARDLGAKGYLDVSISPDGALLAVGRGLPFAGDRGPLDFTVGVYRTSDLSPVVEALPETLDPASSRATTRPAFADDRTLLVPVTEGRLVRYDLGTADPAATTVFHSEDRIENVEVSAANQRVVISTMRRAGGFDVVQLALPTYEEVWRFTGPAVSLLNIQEVHLTADGTRILVCGSVTGSVIDVATGTQVGPAMPGSCGLEELPGGDLLGLSGALQAVRRSPIGEPLGTPTDLQTAGEFRDAVVVGDVAYVATLAPDGAVTIVDAEALKPGSARNQRLAIDTGLTGTAESSPDGRTLAVMTQDGSARFVDIASGRPTGVVMTPDNVQPWWFFGLAFSSDGSEVYLGGLTGGITVFDAVSGARRRVLPLLREGTVDTVQAATLGPAANVVTLPWTMPGGRLAVYNFDRFTILDSATGAELFQVNAPPGDVRDLGNSAVVGDVLVYLDGAAQAHRLSWPDGKPLGDLGRPGESAFLAPIPGTDDVVIWSPPTRTLRVVDVPTGADERPPISLPGIEATWLNVDPTGSRVLVEGFTDSRYHIVDLASGVLVGSITQATATIGGGRFLAGGRVVTPGATVQLWNVDPASWLGIACRTAGRNLTRQEWERFLPAGEPYRPTCPSLPSA